MKSLLYEALLLLCAALVLGCTHSHVSSPDLESTAIDTSVPFDTLFDRGEEMMGRAAFVEATDYFQDLLQAIDSSDLEKHSDCLSELSICYVRRGMFAEAFAAATKVIQLDEQLDDKERLVYSLNTLGSIYVLTRQPADAEKYVRRSLDLAVSLNDSVKIAGRYGTLSEIYLSLNRPDEALAAANEALRLDSLRGDLHRMAIRQVQKASVLEATEHLSEARALLETAQPELRRAGNATSLAICLNQLGSIAVHQQRLAAAAAFYEEALAINLRTGNRNGQVKSHLGLWKALRVTDAERAADHLEAYSLLRDSLFEEGTLQAMADYDARYELERMRQQNKRQERLTRLLIIGAVVFGTVLIIAVLLQLRSIKERNRRVRQWQEKYLAAVAAAETAQNTRGTADAPDGPDESKAPDAASPSSGEAQEQASRDPFIIKVDALLDEQMRACQVDLARLADALCITRTLLNRKVKSIEGITMQEYASRYRAERACMLLGQGRLKVAEVARACGFDDDAYFSRFFRKETGMSPSEFVNKA